MWRHRLFRGWLLLAASVLVRLTPALALLVPASAVIAGPVPFDLHLDVPPIIADSQAPVGCTVTYMIADTADNDLFAARMRIASTETSTPVDNRMPCPPDMPPRVGLRALDVCSSRAGEAKTCVFADMSRGFERGTGIRNTSEIASRCSSDKFSYVGAACWMSGNLSVCNVSCGNSAADAMAQARTRCEDKQQHSCPITASVPVSGP